jgi:hypothetical protein
MEVDMKLSGILGNGRLFFALMLIVALTLAAGSARGDMIEGAINVGAYEAEMDGSDLASSTIFTPFAPTPGTIFLAGGTGDMAGLAFVPGAAGPLDIDDPSSWTFGSGEGAWTTSTFTPDPGGSLAGFDPTAAEMRISLNQSGSALSWGGTMSMDGPVIPEPMTMSILGLGGLALLRRRSRKA